MQHPLQITFRGMDTSPAVEDRARELASRLERFADRITSCHMTIQAPHRPHRSGQPFDVRLRIGVSGAEIAVHRDYSHENLYVAIRDAFDAAVRQLSHRTERAHR